MDHTKQNIGKIKGTHSVPISYRDILPAINSIKTCGKKVQIQSQRPVGSPNIMVRVFTIEQLKVLSSYKLPAKYVAKSKRELQLRKLKNFILGITESDLKEIAQTR